MFNDKSPFRVLVILFGIASLSTFFSTWALNHLSINNFFIAALINSYVISSFVTFIFYYVYLLPRWQKKTNDQYFIEQQITGLNEVAIISMTDRKGNIIFVNDNFCKISGHARSELLGQNHRLIKSDEHSTEFYEKMWGTISKGKIWQGQVKNKAKNGSTYWVDSNIIPLKNLDSERFENFISIRFNITKEKLLELELEHEQAKNIHMGRLAALGEMAGSVAHEINNPLTVIVGNIHISKQLLKRMEDASLRDSIISKLISVEAHSNRIAKIVKGLREFSHGGDTNSNEDILPHGLMNSVLELCSEKLKNYDIDVRIHADDFVFQAPLLQLEQVLINLINNAVDAISINEEKWISIDLRESYDFAHITVTDSGNGIPTDICRKMMLPFFTTKPVGKGTGLGLSISKGLIDKLGGEFFYDSNSANTCFKIILPMSDDSLFKNIQYEGTLEYHSHLRGKMGNHLTPEEIHELALKLAECPLSTWIQKYEGRLGKHHDYIALKSEHERFKTAVTDMKWKLINRTLCDEMDILRSRKQLDECLQSMDLKIEELKIKYTNEPVQKSADSLVS